MSKNRIFSILIVFFLIGIFFAPLFPFNENVIFASFLILFFMLFIFWKNPIVRIVVFSAIFLVIGFWRFYYSLPPYSESFISFFNGEEAEVKGFISNYPQEKEKSEVFTVEVQRIKTNKEWKDVKGRIYILTSKLEDFEYGKNLYLKGTLESIEDSEDFSFRDYFMSRKTFSKMSSPEIKKEDGLSGNPVFSVLFKTRRMFEEKVSQVFVEPFSSLVLGINLGVKNVSKNLMDVFNIVSISHIIVISGYNLSVVANFFKRIFQDFSRRLSFWLPLMSLILFTIFVGAEPPVVRAAIMAGVILFAKKKGRKASGVFSLLFAAFLMTFLNPFVLRYDVGFQLSFLATLGLILTSERLFEVFKKIKIPIVFSEVLSATLSAQIFILPLLIFYFGRLSLIAPLANVLVLPVVPFIMFTSFSVSLLGFISIEIARFLALIPYFFLVYLINVAEYLSKIPFASLGIQKSGFFVIIYYIALSLILLFLKFRNKNEKTAEIS